MGESIKKIFIKSESNGYEAVIENMYDNAMHTISAARYGSCR